MRAPTLYCLINGILTFPGNAKNWTGRGVTWLQSHYWDCQAEKVEYMTDALMRPFFQKSRAIKLWRTLYYYPNRRIVLIGHSNGADVICDALRSTTPKIDTIHLVCPANSASFEENGLNEALRLNQVDRVIVYRAPADGALKAAGTWAGRILGYGTLGRVGPQEVKPEFAHRVSTVNFPEKWGHSDCWHDDHFDQTMGLFVAPEMAAAA